MPQDKTLSNKDYIAGKGDYWTKFTGYLRDANPDGQDFGTTKRSSRIDAAGETARDEMMKNNAMYHNQKTRKGTTLGLLKTLDHMLSTESTGTAAGRRMGMKERAAEEYGRQTARNSKPNYGAGKPVAKPLSAAAGAKMISAMRGKSNGTFAGGSPRSSMSANLKIK